jgi:hypothetical protein
VAVPGIGVYGFPVTAPSRIGTGKLATSGEVLAVHAADRFFTDRVRTGCVTGQALLERHVEELVDTGP